MCVFRFNIFMLNVKKSKRIWACCLEYMTGIRRKLTTSPLFFYAREDETSMSRVTPISFIERYGSTSVDRANPPSTMDLV